MGFQTYSRWSPFILMSSQLKRPSSSHSLLGTLVITSLLACACGAIPEQAGDDGFSGNRSLGTGGGSVAGVSGSAGSASSGGAVGVAGSFGASGSAGTAGGFATGGAVGFGGSLGFGGSGGSAAGAAGSGSGGGFGGQGFGGQGFGGQGFGGQAHGGSGGSGGGSVTFTELYTQYFNNNQFASNCTGGACHNPGTQKGIDFSTQAKGYASVKNNLSKVISQLSGGNMPQTRPRWTSAELALVKAWQTEGAPNN
jgi:hypothetical protein